MKKLHLLLMITGFTLTTGCHAHKANKVVVVKKPHKTQVVLVDNQHLRSNYRIVHVKPKKHSVCKKHNKHWHCH
ncbi:hypothetical protein OS175_13970 [Marinicella sp. S1101]|uniref:hypothetical protein n=1 Tax=Marinicella marina TaxID=2996016 RepID=UPI0022608F3C|nr:hypothetical protein [Marinicella marina]MCX7554980.1 hypothetical protein [Marinicella marina]MDJ1141590.1 hypothetical protein [Marinicella marina]